MESFYKLREMINNPMERQITGEEYKWSPRAGDQGAYTAGQGLERGR